MRTLVDIPDDLLNNVDDLAKHAHISRAEIIRRALRSWIQKTQSTHHKEVFGILKGKLEQDSVLLQQNLRDEW
jgi:metal-responsive CopG/Arc/MetJ family transcriptional regulator